MNLLKKRVITLQDGKIIRDQKDGGHYDLEGSRIQKRSLGGPAPTVTATPAPASAEPEAPAKKEAKTSGEDVLAKMRQAKAEDEAKPVAKRRKFIH